MRTKTKMSAAGLGVVTPAAFPPSTGGPSGHGYTDPPVSRQKLCQNGTVTNCGDIQWEPQSVEGPKGFPAGGPADGQICNGGVSRFRQFTAMHATTDFKYYVTKPGWNQNHNLARSDLNLTPFLTVPYNGQRPPSTLSHSGTLPSGLSGRHVILAVWTIADTGNAFYACSDVTF